MVARKQVLQVVDRAVDDRFDHVPGLWLTSRPVDNLPPRHPAAEARVVAGCELLTHLPEFATRSGIEHVPGQDNLTQGGVTDRFDSLLAQEADKREAVVVRPGKSAVQEVPKLSPAVQQPAAAFGECLQAADQDSRVANLASLPDRWGFPALRRWGCAELEQFAGEAMDLRQPLGFLQDPNQPNPLGQPGRFMPFGALQNPRKPRSPRDQFTLHGPSRLEIVDPFPNPSIQLCRIFMREDGLHRPALHAVLQGVEPAPGLPFRGSWAGALAGVSSIGLDLRSSCHRGGLRGSVKVVSWMIWTSAEKVASIRENFGDPSPVPAQNRESRIQVASRDGGFLLSRMGKDVSRHR